MADLEDLRRRLREERPVAWDQMPDFALYMDQVLSYMDRQVIRFDEEVLTSAMVNNYTKSGLVPRAEGKKYSREHLAYLTVICILKRVMSTRDMDLLIREELLGDRPVKDGYAAFCDSLDSALNITANEMESRAGTDTLADAAIHYALLSYAAGVASSRYVALLRREKTEASGERKHPDRKSGGRKRGRPPQNSGNPDTRTADPQSGGNPGTRTADPQSGGNPGTRTADPQSGGNPGTRTADPQSGRNPDTRTADPGQAAAEARGRDPDGNRSGGWTDEENTTEKESA